MIDQRVETRIGRHSVGIGVSNRATASRERRVLHRQFTSRADAGRDQATIKGARAAGTTLVTLAAVSGRGGSHEVVDGAVLDQDRYEVADRGAVEVVVPACDNGLKFLSRSLRKAALQSFDHRVDGGLLLGNLYLGGIVWFGSSRICHASIHPSAW